MDTRPGAAAVKFMRDGCAALPIGERRGWGEATGPWPHTPEKGFNNYFFLFTNLDPVRKIVDQIRLVLQLLGYPPWAPGSLARAPGSIPPSEKEILRPTMARPVPAEAYNDKSYDFWGGFDTSHSELEEIVN